MDHSALKLPLQFAFVEQRDISRPPSRSPVRRHNPIAHELDPLLSDLSPTSTLEALQSTDAAVEGEVKSKSSLIETVAAASATERAWGIKAALVGKKSREWYREIAAWPWPTGSGGDPNGFELLSEGQSTAQEQRSNLQDRGEATLDEHDSPNNQQKPHWGGLPLDIIEEYDSRIEQIREDMETLELEELKDHVRASHLPRDPRRSMGQAESGSQLHYAHMDDFTAIITATIMQTLPDISRLNHLLQMWSVRLLVLRQVPGFLESMEKAQIAMKSAWNAIDISDVPSNQVERKLALNREAFNTMRYVLESRIFELGQRLDYMLDALEGREDTIPDVWIEDMEAIEVDFGNWVVKMERFVLENELEAEQRKALESVVFTNSSTDSQLPVTEAPLAPDEPSQNSIETRLASPVDTGAATGAAEEPFESSHPISGAPITPEANRSEESPATAMGPISDDSEKISSHLKKLLLLREASQERSDALVPISPPPSPSRKPKLDAPSSDSFDPRPHQIDVSSGDVTDTVPRSRSHSRPAPLVLAQPRSKGHSKQNSSISSDASYPGSATSDYFSDMSSPEIQHASRAEYFGAPVEVTTPGLTKNAMSPSGSVSRHSSQRTERGRPMSDDFSAKGFASGFTSPVGQRSRASSFLLETTIPEVPYNSHNQSRDCKDQIGHLRTRSASIQSFETLPRAIVGTNDSFNKLF